MHTNIYDAMTLMIIILGALYGFAVINAYSEFIAWAVLIVIIASFLGGIMQFGFKQGFIKAWIQAIKSGDKSLLENVQSRVRINAAVYFDIGNVFIVLLLVLFCLGLIAGGVTLGKYALAITAKVPVPIN